MNPFLHDRRNALEADEWRERMERGTLTVTREAAEWVASMHPRESCTCYHCEQHRIRERIAYVRDDQYAPFDPVRAQEVPAAYHTTNPKDSATGQ